MDIHRYFPEWADRPARRGALREADRYSYLAGGYAEEFGYRVQPGLPAPGPAVDGEPERSKQWRAQIGGLHPGYPECPKPLDRDLIGPASATVWRAHPSAEPVRRLPDLNVIWVGQHQHATRNPSGLPARLIYMWKVLRIRHRNLSRLF